MKHPRRVAAGVAALALAAAALTGCDLGSKYTEPFHDAPRAGTNSSPAEIGTMPDGFSNWASKCDHGNRVYTAYHGDNKYAAVAVVADDPSC